MTAESISTRAATPIGVKDEVTVATTLELEELMI